MLIKSMGGLQPYDDATLTWFSKLKLGSVLSAAITQPRNPKLHRKWFALVTLGYEYWCEIAPRAEYKGLPVEPNFEKFRQDITILAGYYTATVNLRGEVRLVAKSIAFGSMAQDEFEKLYNATLNVLLSKVFQGAPQWTAERIEAVLSSIGEFA